MDDTTNTANDLNRDIGLEDPQYIFLHCSRFVGECWNLVVGLAWNLFNIVQEMTIRKGPLKMLLFKEKGSG